MDMTKDQINTSLQTFVRRRDELLHEDSATFEYSLKRFVDFCQKDNLAQQVLNQLPIMEEFNIEDWWQQLSWQNADLHLPENSDEELIVQFKIITSLSTNPRRVFEIGMTFGKRKMDDSIEIARSILIRPFVEEFGNKMAKTGNLVTPEERALQAVPLICIPRSDEIGIFLSHKTVDKPLVYRYYYALRELGFSPWLDETNMPAGTNLEREVVKGFAKSCAAVFFITESFKDESYLAAEIDYAIAQKRKKGKKFIIVTLRYSDATPVPDLLETYVHKVIQNDLQGFREIIRSLPIELGPVRWKQSVVEE